MPSERQFESKFLREFQQPLAAWHFKYVGDFRFRRDHESVWHELQFAPTHRYLAKRFEFTFFAGVNHPEVNELCGPRLFPEGRSTVAIRLISDTRPETFGYWHLEDSSCVPEVLQYVEQRALPFLERFSDLNEIRRALEGSWPLPFILGRTEIEWLRAAIMALQGDPDGAIALLVRTQEERIHMVPGSRWPLETLRQRLIKRYKKELWHEEF